MATKTISLRLEAYEKLKRARRYREESFSEVVLRARWSEESTTGAALLARYREHGAFFTDDELAAVEDRLVRPRRHQPRRGLCLTGSRRFSSVSRLLVRLIQCPPST
jgi:hypothetical protein